MTTFSILTVLLLTTSFSLNKAKKPDKDFISMLKMDRLAAVLRKKVDVCLCDIDSSGSDHSPENSSDLSELVNSFIERDDEFQKHDKESQEEEEREHKNIETESDSCSKLRNLFGSKKNDNINVKEAIQFETKQALQQLVGIEGRLFKRQLMAHLRKKGFDAGICKSKMEKFRSFPSGDHECIDVNINGNRYIVEIFLAREFEIARPTSQYTSLLDSFPEIFVGKLEELKQIVRIMCYGIKESMKSKEMHVPPWRRNGYMLAKWFSSYKRMINEASSKKDLGLDDVFLEKKLVDFKSIPAKNHQCRGDLGSKMGYLAAEIGCNCNGNELYCSCR